MNGPNGPWPNRAQMNPLEWDQMGSGRAQMNGPKWARDRAQMNGPNGPQLKNHFREKIKSNPPPTEKITFPIHAATMGDMMPLYPMDMPNLIKA